MGQYFIPTLLDSAGRITGAVHPEHYGVALYKLSGQSHAGTAFLDAVETLLTLDGGSRLSWAGDEAHPNPGHHANLYWLTEPHQFVRFADLIDPDAGIEPNATRVTPGLTPRFVCNRDRGEYFDKQVLPRGTRGAPRHLLPTLTADGYGITGPWARNHIYLTNTRPEKAWTQLFD